METLLFCWNSLTISSVSSSPESTTIISYSVFASVFWLHRQIKVEYKYNDGIKIAEENGKFVALDITIDDKLYEEFMYRKLLRQCFNI